MQAAAGPFIATPCVTDQGTHAILLACRSCPADPFLAPPACVGNKLAVVTPTYLIIVLMCIGRALTYTGTLRKLPTKGGPRGRGIMTNEPPHTQWPRSDSDCWDYD